MKDEACCQIPILRVDGGGSMDNLLMQFQSDILGIPIQRSRMPETTALGAAYLAGLAVGLWRNTDEIAHHWQSSASYEPKMPDGERERLYRDWKRAVERAKGWAKTL
jgi:glycerol kinase